MHGRYRWFIVAVFFAFMLLHQADKLLIGPLTTPIMETFGINEAQMGAVVTGALIVGTIFYPLWGYLSDRYARAKLLAAASAIWGSTTWLGAVAPTYPAFVAALAPWLAGLIAVGSSLHDAILIICLSTWALCAFFFIFAAYLVPPDIAKLRAEMRRRAGEVISH